MKKKLELQTIVVLLCALGIAVSWIGIQIARDNFGKWTEAKELHFTTSDLLGLGARSELRCAGAVIGHVRKVVAGISAQGVPQFTVIAGVGSDFSAWKFAPHGTVKFSVVESALSPSWIDLELDAQSDGVQPCRPKDGPPPLLPLAREPSKSDLESIATRIDQAITKLTEPQNGNAQSSMDELAAAIRHLDGVMASLDGQSRSTETDPAKRPPMDQLLTNLDSTTGSLKNITASLEKTVGPNGALDQTLVTLNGSMVRLQGLTDEMSKTVSHLNLRVDSSLGKMNTLLDETNGVMTLLHDKVERLGGTFLGRMLIAKPDKPAAATLPPEKEKSARKTRD